MAALATAPGHRFTLGTAVFVSSDATTADVQKHIAKSAGQRDALACGIYNGCRGRTHAPFRANPVGIPGAPTLHPTTGERQYDYVNVEYGLFHRSDSEITSHVGYAGSTKIGNDQQVCYHNSGFVRLRTPTTCAVLERQQDTTYECKQQDGLTATT